MVDAFDPGGPPAAGGIPKIVTGNWEWINYQPTGGSYSPQFEINHENVQYLGLNWIFPYTAIESLFPNQQAGSGAPVIIVDGVAYVGKNNRAIHAVDAATGKEVWFSDEQSNLWDRTALLAEFPFFQSTWGHTHGMNYYRGMGDSGWLITSNQPCLLSATNAADGSIAWSMGVEQLCGTTAEYGNPEKNSLLAIDTDDKYDHHALRFDYKKKLQESYRTNGITVLKRHVKNYVYPPQLEFDGSVFITVRTKYFNKHIRLDYGSSTTSKGLIMKLNIDRYYN